MSNFTRAKPLGWVEPDPITAAQINQIDENLVKAPNFADGCTFTPGGWITIAGTTGFKFTGTQVVYGASGSIWCQVGGGITVGDGTNDSPFVVANGSHGQVSSGGTWNFLAGAIVGLATPITCTGTGHVRKRKVMLADEDKTYGINDGDLFMVLQGVLSTTRYLTLSRTGAADGDCIRVVNMDTTISLSVQGLHPSHSGALELRYAPTYSLWYDFVYNLADDAWYQTGCGPD